MQATVIPQYRIKPGRLGDAREMFAEGTQLVLKHGASDVRFRRFVLGGPIVGVHQALIAFDSMEAFGNYWESINADETFTDFAARLNDPDSPVVALGMIQTTNIADFGSGATGDVALVRRWKVHPGRLDGFLALAEEAAAAGHEQDIRVLVRRITVGDLAGQFITAGFADDMPTLGAYMDRLESDRDLQRIQARAFGPDSPAELLGMAISVGVPI